MMEGRHERVVPNIRDAVRFYYSHMPYDNYVPMHWHSEIEVVCVLDGHLRFTIDGMMLNVRGGQFAMLPSGAIHDVASRPNHAYVLQVPLRTIRQVYDDPENVTFLNGQVHLPEYGEVIDCFAAMGKTVSRASPGSSFDFSISLLNILKRMFTVFCIPDTNNRSADNVKEIITYLHEHATEPLSVGELARTFGYNPSYLSRMFKTQTGVTLVSYLYDVRVSRLHDDLLTTDESIGSLLLKNGLTNQRMTREVFRRRYGVLPSDLRKRAS